MAVSFIVYNAVQTFYQ